MKDKAKSSVSNNLLSSIFYIISIGMSILLMISFVCIMFFVSIMFFKFSLKQDPSSIKKPYITAAMFFLTLALAPLVAIARVIKKHLLKKYFKKY